MVLPRPETFGMPPKFAEWRHNQAGAIMKIVDGPSRFLTLVCPTGFGKSLTYVAGSAIRGGRTAILTSTKGLQSQLVRDFGDGASPLMVDIRGRNSYRCNMEHDGTKCDHGPCIAGYKCRLKDDGGCEYYDQLGLARLSPMVVTNYAYWMTAHEHGEGLGAFDNLVCDEAHDSPDLVSSFLTISIDRKDETIHLPNGDLGHFSVEEWGQWAAITRDRVRSELESLKVNILQHGGDRRLRQRYSKLKSMHRDLEKIASIVVNRGTWVVDDNDGQVSFCPVWPKPYCEEVLFRGIKKVVLTSASIRQKTASMLGADVSNELVEFPHTFPVQNRRVIHVPTARVNFRITDAEMRQVLARIDQIISGRLDRKGIVHTVSYKRRDLVISSSRYRNHMVIHSKQNTVTQVQAFKEMEPPAVLVSPSVATGYDFPMDECRYQIVMKIPYPDTVNRIVKARAKSDPDYPAYVAMQQLVQAVGRGNRTPDDVCENFVIDDNMIWFREKYRDFAPKWFLDACVRVNVIPKAPNIAGVGD